MGSYQFAGTELLSGRIRKFWKERGTLGMYSLRDMTLGMYFMPLHLSLRINRGY